MEVVKATYGWDTIKPGDVGIIKEIYESYLTLQFPDLNYGWGADFNDIRYEKTKIMKEILDHL